MTDPGFPIRRDRKRRCGSVCHGKIGGKGELSETCVA
jgi:hypothetical protein